MLNDDNLILVKKFLFLKEEKEFLYENKKWNQDANQMFFFQSI